MLEKLIEAVKKYNQNTYVALITNGYKLAAE